MFTDLLKAFTKVYGNGRKILTEMDNLCKKEVFVGITDSRYAAIAAYNEYGTSTIPPRPFFQQAMDKHEGEIVEMMADRVGQVMNGATAESVYNEIGVQVRQFVVDEINSGNFVPNAPATIAKKGSSKPLVDTGGLSNAIVYEVRSSG